MKKIKLLALSLLMATMGMQQTNAQCPVPTNLVAASLDSASSQLNWAALSGVSSYKIKVEDSGNNPVPFLVTGNSTTNSFLVNGLLPGFAYKFKVRTLCGGSQSTWSAWYTFVAGGGAINCNPLTGLSISNTTATGSIFTWNPSLGGLGYWVKVEDATGNPINFSSLVNVTTNSFTISNLLPSSNYKVKIRKRCAVGVNGPWSAWMFFSTSALRVGQDVHVAESSIIQLSPNPANNYFELNVADGSDEKIKTVQLYDMTGKMVADQLVSVEATNKFPIQDLQSGVYIVKVQTNNKSISKRLIVSN